jgi:hypothetical protein
VKVSDRRGARRALVLCLLGAATIGAAVLPVHPLNVLVALAVFVVAVIVMVRTA